MTRQTLNTAASIFGVCFLLCVGLQLLSLGMILGLHDWAYSMHSRLFSISEPDFDLAVYYILGLMKTLGLTFFLVPWAALKIVARRMEEAGVSPELS